MPTKLVVYTSCLWKQINLRRGGGVFTGSLGSPGRPAEGFFQRQAEWVLELGCRSKLLAVRVQLRPYQGALDPFLGTLPPRGPRGTGCTRSTVRLHHLHSRRTTCSRARFREKSNTLRSTDTLVPRYYINKKNTFNVVRQTQNFTKQIVKSQSHQFWPVCAQKERLLFYFSRNKVYKLVIMLFYAPP